MCNMFDKSNKNIFNERKSIDLIDAAMEGRVEIIDSLIKEGANFNYVDECGDTALSQAAINGHVETVRKLLTNLCARYSKNRAFLVASQAGHSEIIDILIEAKVDESILKQVSG